MVRGGGGGGGGEVEKVCVRKVGNPDPCIYCMVNVNSCRAACNRDAVLWPCKQCVSVTLRQTVRPSVCVASDRL